MGELCAEASPHTCTNCMMLEHHAPHPTVPVLPTVVPLPAVDPVVILVIHGSHASCQFDVVDQGDAGVADQEGSIGAA